MTDKKTPAVTVSRWDGCLLPRDEIKASLLYLAHKTGKTVRFGMYPGEPRYSSRVVNVFVCTQDNGLGDAGISAVTIRGQDYVFTDAQRSYCLELKGEYILDDNSTTIAVVDRNNIIIRFEFTAADNDAARVILACVAEKAIPLLRFDVDEYVESRTDEAAEQYRLFFSAALSDRVEAKRNENAQAERDAENHYHSLIAAERLKIATTEELAGLERLQRTPNNGLASKQARQIGEMEYDAFYEEITLLPNGSVSATTGEIVIEYADWEFPMGQYEVLIDPKGRITINVLVGHSGTDYPHPHISDSGAPCLGNIQADVARMIGQFRIAEALQVLFQFLVSYTPEGAYVKIGKFDETGEFVDPDEDPCEDCEDKYSPYCIWQCETNSEGWYGCSDCNDYRSDHCYEECQYNEDITPCDDCTDAGSEKCYLRCRHNQEWERANPCDDCQDKDCGECPWEERRSELKKEEHAKTGGVC